MLAFIKIQEKEENKEKNAKKPYSLDGDIFLFAVSQIIVKKMESLNFILNYFKN